MVHFITDTLVPFLSNPGGTIHQTEIASLIKRPRPTIRRELALLEKEGIIKKSRKGKLALYCLNLNNIDTHTYIVVAEKTKILRKDLHLREFINSVTAHYTNDMLIFGSATDDFRHANDIDILVIGKTNIEKLKKLAQNLGKEPHIINTTYDEISHSLKEEILKKHIIIINAESVVRWLYW